MDNVFILSIIIIVYMLTYNYFKPPDSAPIDSNVVGDGDSDDSNNSFGDGLDSISCKMDTSILKTFNQGIKLTESSRFQQMVDIKNKEYIDLQNFDSKEKQFSCSNCNSLDCNTTPNITEDKLIESYVNLPNANGLTNEFIDGSKCCPNCYSAVIVDGEKKCRKECVSGDFQDYSGDCLSKKKFTEFIQGNASF